MADLSEPNPIEYGVYAASDAGAMTGLLAETFVRRDPPAVAVGLTPDESHGGPILMERSIGLA